LLRGHLGANVDLFSLVEVCEDEVE